MNLQMSLMSHLITILLLSNLEKILVGKPEGKRPLGRPRYRWVDSVKIKGMGKVQEIVYE
jgi:hypothetical protein